MSKKDCKEVTMPQQTGGVPNYIVNLDELEGVLESAIRKSSDGCVRTGVQRSKGFLILSEDYGVEIANWGVPYDIWLTGLTFAQEEVRNMGYEDYINIYIDDELYFETIFLKEIQEKKDFRNMVKVEEGSIIKIEYINDTGIEKEFKIDLEYLNKEPISSPPIIPPPIDPDPPIEPPKPEPEPEEPEVEPPTELVPIYRVYMRYEGGVTTDLDMYVNLFNESDGSDISPSQTVGFSRRGWGINDTNLAKMTQMSDNHLGLNDREIEPEIIEIYGQPSKYFRFYATNYKDGYKLEEIVTMTIYKLDEFGNDGELLGTIIKQPEQFHSIGAKVLFFDFNITTETVTEL